MKTFLFLALSFSVAAHAAQSVKDYALLGEYKLVKTNAKSEIQTAKLVYNHDSQLVVMTDRSEDFEYQVSEANDKGVIVDFQDEPNCDGDEAHCYYDSQVLIKLGSAVAANGQSVPQLSIEVTSSDAWDESGKTFETNTYVLNYSKPLADAIPFYINFESPADLKDLSAECNAKLNEIAYDDATSYLGAQEICPILSSATVMYRDSFEDAFAQIKVDYAGKKLAAQVKLLSAAQIKSEVFDKAKALAAKYKASKGTVTAKDILEQLNKVQAYVSSKDQVYAYSSLRGVSLFVVEKEAKLVHRLNVRTSTEYAK